MLRYSAAFHVCDPLVTDCLIPQGFAAVQRPEQRRCLAPRRRQRPRGGEGARGDVHCQSTRPRHAHTAVTHRVPVALTQLNADVSVVRSSHVAVSPSL